MIREQCSHKCAACIFQGREIGKNPGGGLVLGESYCGIVRFADNPEEAAKMGSRTIPGKSVPKDCPVYEKSKDAGTI